MRVLEEEAQHLAGRVGPARVGVGTGRAAAEPGVPRAVHDPLHDHRPPVRIGAQRAARPSRASTLSAAAWASCAYPVLPAAAAPVLRQSRPVGRPGPRLICLACQA